MSALLLCLAPVALDGDTIRCANVGPALRMTGIDAPELPGHCRVGRTCAPGDPVKAKTDLQAAMKGTVRFRILKVDVYRRIVVAVYYRGQNLSCRQLASGNAIYKPEWDSGKIVAKECPQ
jgi:endonuclease YncB( thermonuclease family)